MQVRKRALHHPLKSPVPPENRPTEAALARPRAGCHQAGGGEPGVGGCGGGAWRARAPGRGRRRVEGGIAGGTAEVGQAAE